MAQDDQRTLLNVSILEGRFTIRQDEDGNAVVLSYGSPIDMPAASGDVILALAIEVERLRSLLPPDLEDGREYHEDNSVVIHYANGLSVDYPPSMRSQVPPIKTGG